jgi:hypothetical protein
MLKSSSLCLYSSNLVTFWLKIEQFWPFEEISIFSNCQMFVSMRAKKPSWDKTAIFLSVCRQKKNPTKEQS